MRATTAIRRLALSYGMPTDAPASDILHASRLRRERERRLGMSVAVSIFNGVCVALGGGSSDSVIAPFLDGDEMETMREEREEREQLAAQRQQIAMLRRMSERHGG